MTVSAALRLMAGTVVLISLALGSYINPNWFYLTGFVGLNLLQSAFTGWCPAITIFKKLGLQQESCNVAGMNVNQGIHIMAGSIILGTVIAVLFFSINILIFVITAIVGVSLLQSAFSGWCPGMSIVRFLGFKDAQ
ncbi:YgaP family membrane protein [Neptunomonas japonica]|uniref:Inner membrane protein YgaP-like transmembrane domain-containing protein n=1 Tax=Neptunomonas japonica JAMM 1380 TaxID=1441457 RepID=A0A7R6PAC3_9GAMM|nr:DUF2892 domain-containing protein [Neptunomonas japonica]BBB30168.1 conserved hypothetical protein [Neptunomonas japonica JAMM 1380]